eukprot:COSAG01_NODE_662_length_14431_cov_31.385775_7_plen_188_part_00
MKNELRKEFLKKRQTISEANRLKQSKEANQHLINFVKEHKINCIAAYMPILNELQLEELFIYCLKNKIDLCFPKIINNRLNFYQIDNINKDFKKGPYNIEEPKNTCKQRNLSEIQLILLPGLAFDLNYNRIGYGKGYYDRTLKNYKAITLGICYKQQILIESTIKKEPWDISLSGIATSTGIQLIKK